MVVERYQECTYESHWRGTALPGYVYNPSTVTCVLPGEIAPGDGVLLFDPETGESAFTVAFGKNLAGPDEVPGSFEVALASSAELAGAGKRSTGKSLTAVVRGLNPKPVRRAAALDGLAEENDANNLAEFSVFTKANKLDLAVTTQPVTGAVGDTVELSFTLVNNGPSDGSGPSVLITAPAGTVLLPSEFCHTPGGDEGQQQPESPQLRCNYERLFPSGLAGLNKLTVTAKLKVKSTPGAGGTVVVRNSGPSTESNPGNNTAPITFAATDDTGGTGGGSLPITGTSITLVAGVGGAVIVAGAVLMVLARRRRVVTVVPQDIQG